MNPETQSNGNIFTGITLGMVGGFFELYLKGGTLLGISATNFSIETVLMALICGVAGVIGKHVGGYLIKKVKQIIKPKDTANGKANS